MIQRAALVVVMWWPAMAWAQAPPPASFLLQGQRVKVDADTLRNGRLFADEIELVEGQDDDIEIEGRVRDLDLDERSFRIHGFLVRAHPSSHIYEDTEEQIRDFSDLAAGLRVKVEAEWTEGAVIEADEIRLLPANNDDDLEIEAPIAAVNLDRSEFVVLEKTISFSANTQIDGMSAPGGSSGGGAFSGIRRDDDEPLLAPLRFGDVQVGGKAGVGLEIGRHREQDHDARGDFNRINQEAQIEVSAPIQDSIEAYGRLNARHDRFPGGGPFTPTQTALEVREAYVFIGGVLHPRVGLQVGRQRFRDRREWWYDDRLDAVRVHHVWEKWRSEVAIAKTLLGATGSRSDQLYVMARSAVQLPRRTSIAGYWLRRNDTTDRDEDPIWYGLSASGRVTDRLRYWTELAQVRGRRGDREIRGWGADIGGSYRFRNRWRPTVAIGYAYGSGDNDRSDGIDGNFRQTRLNDNSARIGGLKRYRYYGVALDPELSNLTIRTVDLGVRPSDSWSVNVVLHDYRQVRADDGLGDAEIDLEPGGDNPRIGYGVDVIFALRRFSRVDINLLGGWFDPGPAFEGPRSSFLVVAPQLRFYF